MRRRRRGTPTRGATSRALLVSLLVALGVIGALAGAGSGAHPARLGGAVAAQARPNVVVIETDDQTLESMRVMDNVNSMIGGQGATFKKNFVNLSLCCPSRATFLTGQYAHNHGVWSNRGPRGGFDRFQSLHANNNLAIWLRQAGYYTALIGKYLNGYVYEPPVPRGWSEWHASANHKVYDYVLDDNGTLVNYGHAPADYKGDVLTRKAVNLVRRRAPQARPFFLWLTYIAPHVGGPYPDPNPPGDCDQAPKPAPRHAHAFDSEPLPRPPNFNEADVSDKPAQIRRLPRLNSSAIAYIRRNYRCELESLLSVDEGVKKVIDALRAQGELNRTLIAFTSDNGFFHGEHRIPKNKARIYEESIRVPLQIRGPGIPRGVGVGHLSSNADLAPTVVDVANADPGLVMDGRSLIPVAKDPDIEQGRALLVEQPSFEAVRTMHYVYVEHHTGEKELYYLKRDRFEVRSRHNDPAYRSVRRRLATRLDELRSCAGSSCRTHG